MRGIRIGEASHPGPPGVMHLYGDEDRHTDVLLEEQMAESIDLATQMVELFGDDENTQETTGGGTHTELFHVGPDVVMMSETEAFPPEAIISPFPPPYVDEAPPLCGEQGGIFDSLTKLNRHMEII